MAEYDQNGEVIVNKAMQDFSWKFVYDDDYGVDLFLDTNRQRLYVTQNNRVVVFDTIKSPESGNIIVGENSGGRLPLLSHAQSTFVDINQNLYVLEMHYKEAYKLELTLFNFNYRVWYWPFSSMNATKLLQGNGKCFRMALDKNLNMYITEFDAHRVVKWHSPEYTNYSVVAGTTDIYVADKGNRRIQKWSLNAREGITVVSDVYEPKQILLDCYGNFLTNDGYRVKLYNSFVTTGLDGIYPLTHLDSDVIVYDESNENIYGLDVRNDQILKLSIRREILLYNNTANTSEEQRPIVDCGSPTDSVWETMGEIIPGNNSRGYGIGIR
ncbi:unnamed protein product [Rotaria sp. Silwood2]|nr:unnamed protein product [Rotaria sp. Silwood2]